jgi:uncharacterized protein DUF6788
MSPTLEVLEQRKKSLYQELEAIGPFRRGTITENYRKCGKANCRCAQPEHPGHGPRYLWTATLGGKSYGQQLELGPELEKIEQEVTNYRRFQQWMEQWIELNEKICQRQPVRSLEDGEELEQLKKKLQKRYSRKPSKR